MPSKDVTLRIRTEGSQQASADVSKASKSIAAELNQLDKVLQRQQKIQQQAETRAKHEREAFLSDPKNKEESLARIAKYEDQARAYSEKADKTRRQIHLADNMHAANVEIAQRQRVEKAQEVERKAQVKKDADRLAKQASDEDKLTVRQGRAQIQNINAETKAREKASERAMTQSQRDEKAEEKRYVRQGMAQIKEVENQTKAKETIAKKDLADTISFGKTVTTAKQKQAQIDQQDDIDFRRHIQNRNEKDFKAYAKQHEATTKEIQKKFGKGSGGSGDDLRKTGGTFVMGQAFGGMVGDISGNSQIGSAASTAATGFMMGGPLVGGVAGAAAAVGLYFQQVHEGSKRATDALISYGSAVAEAAMQSAKLNAELDTNTSFGKAMLRMADDAMSASVKLTIAMVKADEWMGTVRTFTENPWGLGVAANSGFDTQQDEKTFLGKVQRRATAVGDSQRQISIANSANVLASQQELDVAKAMADGPLKTRTVLSKEQALAQTEMAAKHKMELQQSADGIANQGAAIKDMEAIVKKDRGDAVYVKGKGGERYKISGTEANTAAMAVHEAQLEQMRRGLAESQKADAILPGQQAKEKVKLASDTASQVAQAERKIELDRRQDEKSADMASASLTRNKFRREREELEINYKAEHKVFTEGGKSTVDIDKKFREQKELNARQEAETILDYKHAADAAEINLTTDKYTRETAALELRLNNELRLRQQAGTVTADFLRQQAAERLMIAAQSAQQIDQMFKQGIVQADVLRQQAEEQVARYKDPGWYARNPTAVANIHGERARKAAVDQMKIEKPALAKTPEGMAQIEKMAAQQADAGRVSELSQMLEQYTRPYQGAHGTGQYQKGALDFSAAFPVGTRGDMLKSPIVDAIVLELGKISSNTKPNREGLQ